MVDPAAAQALEALKEHLAVIVDIRSSMALLSWDQETQMPPGGGPTRARQLSTLSRIAHERFVAAKTQELLDAAEPLLETLDPGSDEATLLRIARRDLDRARKLPAEFVADRARAASESTEIWRKARPANDFRLFRPHLERMVEFARRTAEYLGYAAHPYDALLDTYEPETTTRDVATLFNRLREVTVPLVEAIADRGDTVNPGILDQEYPQAEQRKFALSIITAFGYDTDRGRLDTSPHPFSTGISRDDVRITTRYPPRLLGAIFGIFHESGHAMYSQGTAPALDRTLLADGASNGIHESQSRLWENLIGRSRTFWEYAFPKMQELFSNQLAGVDANTFYRAVNRVRRSLIRVEADEVTYNLHIMVRFELEQALVAGELNVQDLPDAWEAKMQAYLGITPPTDADGVMQDIHWSGMGFGYFPSYTIGNVVSVQLFDAALRVHPDLPDQIRRGEFRPLLAWLRDHVHAHGRKFFPKDLLRRATGSTMTPEPYIRYLQEKFGEIYGLKPRP
ncbi:MAG TPA: carboxypeptidase M32 [bacterium]|nr:carboxypeptidase M32 [bacterium]